MCVLLFVCQLFPPKLKFVAATLYFLIHEKLDFINELDGREEMPIKMFTGLQNNKNLISISQSTRQKTRSEINESCATFIFYYFILSANKRELQLKLRKICPISNPL